MNQPRTPTRLRKTCTFVALSLLALPSAVFAQSSASATPAPLPVAVAALDPATFVDGLTREGMAELLEHLAATEPVKDAVLQQQIRTAQLRIRANDQTLAQEQREKAMDDALTGLRDIIAKNRDHEQRPIWQTDLAEVLLYTILQSRHFSAAEFYEFGVPTVAQKEAFEKYVPELIETLIDADLRFFTLQSDLPKDADHVQRRVNSGLWERLITQYYQTRTQFFLCHAAYYTTLLPDSHPVWARLSTNPWLGTSGRTAAQSRTRLLAIAVERLEKLHRERAPSIEGLKEPVQALWGRVLTAQNKPADSITQFDAVINSGNSDLVDLSARLGKAIAMERNRQPGPAIDALVPLKNHAQAQGNLLYKLLVVDTMHGIMLRRANAGAADRRDTLLAQAYQPYEDLLNDSALGDAAEPLRNYVYERWESTITDDSKVDALPPMVVMAVGQLSRSNGQNFMLDAEGAAAGPEQNKLREQGLKKLNRAITMSQSVLKRANLLPAVRAGAMFNLALSTYFRDKGDLKNQLDTAKILIDLSEQLPEQPISEEAMGGAITILRPLHAQTPRPDGVPEMYERAANVLLTKFPTSAVTDNERLYYGFQVLQTARKFSEAAAVYARIPAGHADYFTAQQERLTCLQELFRAATGEAKKTAATTVTTAANTLRDEATRAMADSASPLATSAKTAAGSARLVLADMSLEQADLNSGLRILDGFETEFSDQDLLVRQALQKRILALVEVGQIDRAAQQSSAMMTQFPNDAAPVIDVVLSRMDENIESLRRKAALELVERNKNELNAKAVTMAQTASRLAKLLVDWADTRKLAAEEMVPYKLILAKSLRMAGQAQESLDLVKPFAAQFQDDAQVIHAMGESYFLLGGTSNLRAASPFFDTLITRIQPENQKYPTIWWNAWVRRLSINDQLGQSTSEIPLRVQQLLLLDPNLGGDVFKVELERLKNKYALTR